MTPAPAFLFDLDGTLADTLADIAATTNHVRTEHGLAPVELATARTYVGDGARMLLRRALAERWPEPTEAQLDAAFAIYVEHHRSQCTEHVRLYPGVTEHLTRLAAAGHPLAIVTNKPARFAEPIAAHTGLDAFVSVIVGGDSLPVRKPDPAPLRLALDRLGATTRDAVMVGDGPQDIRAGKALGLRTIGCLYGFHDPRRLRDEDADAYWSAFGDGV